MLLLTDASQLREIDGRAVAAARCLSRRLDAIATPVTYHTLFLNERIVAPDTESRYPNLLRHVSTFTNHVVVRSDLDPDGIRRVLDRVQRLKTVRYVDHELWLGPCEPANGSPDGATSMPSSGQDGSGYLRTC